MHDIEKVDDKYIVMVINNVLPISSTYNLITAYISSNYCINLTLPNVGVALGVGGKELYTCVGVASGVDCSVGEAEEGAIADK